jgi:8-amino-7-oxononanoate synthase
MSRSAEQELEAIDAAGLRRRPRVLDSAQGSRIRLGEREMVNFSSNDYLGLANHPALAGAAARAALDFGFGSGASRLICGTLRPHAELEEKIADFKGTEAALCFGSGFAAGSGVVPALVGPGDHVVLDKLSHACLVDGARASGATLRIFPHNRVDQLDRLLGKIRAASAGARILVITESVFSMDGDRAPLARLLETKDKHGALLLLDEAHATGVIGPRGRGLAAALGLSHRVDFQMGTLSKALGCHGGFVAARRVWIDLIYNRARSFIFATAPPVPVVAAAAAALDLCGGHEGEIRRHLLDKNTNALADTLGITFEPESPIVPVVLGEAESAVAKSTALDAAGVLVPAIRFPTVPKGAARLRFTATADHREEDFSLLRAAWVEMAGPM